MAEYAIVSIIVRLPAGYKTSFPPGITNEAQYSTDLDEREIKLLQSEVERNKPPGALFGYVSSSTQWTTSYRLGIWYFIKKSAYDPNYFAGVKDVRVEGMIDGTEDSNAKADRYDLDTAYGILKRRIINKNPTLIVFGRGAPLKARLLYSTTRNKLGIQKS